MPDFSVLHTKLNPPRPPRHTLVRPRLNSTLCEALDHRVTIVQASTGYGKSTALAGLAGLDAPLFWYSVGEGDGDPQQFLAHIITAFRFKMPRLLETPLALLQDAYTGEPAFDPLHAAADALLNALNSELGAPALLVIDDYHLAASPGVNTLADHLITFSPPYLHTIIATRYPPSWDNLVSWRARGEVLQIKHDALAFNRDEIAALFCDTYGLALTPCELDLIQDKTEGWPIALQLVWQEIRAKPQVDMEMLLGPGSESLDTLFAYLAKNVLIEQPPEVQEFLLQTSVLRDLDVPACEAVLASGTAAAMLAYLAGRDLFITSLAEGHYRYHHLFHDFLREQDARRDTASMSARRCRAAAFYQESGNMEEAVYHFLHAAAFENAARLVEHMGDGLLRAGRLDTLTGWLDAIPAEIVAAHPLLMFLLGDLARLRSRFDDALAWYAQAERVWRSSNDIGGLSRALRGAALVYLDTVRPSRAEALLEESLRLNDGLDDRAARARLLDLLAENKLNMGKAGEAEALRLQARLLREEGPSEDVLSVRVKLRTGRLDEAREILASWAQEERGQMHPPRAHRETLLILSLIHSLQGRGDAAFATAQDALTLAAQLRSPFVSAVGEMRLGHAYQVLGDLASALRYYQAAMTLGDQIAVPRTRAEARWGMTRAHGFAGDLDAARQDAREGIEIGSSAGDAWIVALVQIALGASLVLGHQCREGAQVLGDALAAFRACGDKFGVTAARLWLALAHWRQNQRERALAHFDQAIALAESEHYEYLITTRTLLGWQDERVIVPLLLAASRRESRNLRVPPRRHDAFASHLLTGMGLGQVIAHAGYQLRVQTLGTFRVWRGADEVALCEWQRRKARELFQLFLTCRGRLLEREEIFELLWANESPQAAARGFKVALNALKVLEPARAPDDPPAFIIREDSAYGLRPGADIWIDVDEFTSLLDQAEKTGDLNLYQHALDLYQDDYLCQVRYADWAVKERDRLLAFYLRGVDRLAAGLLARGEHEQVIAWCERLLARDRCWENAYRLMMRAFGMQGNRAQARRVFEQCQRALREDLDVAPSPVTEDVLRSIVAGP